MDAYLPNTPRLRRIATAIAFVAAALIVLALYSSAVSSAHGSSDLRDRCIANGIAPSLCPD